MKRILFVLALIASVFCSPARAAYNPNGPNIFNGFSIFNGATTMAANQLTVVSNAAVIDVTKPLNVITITANVSLTFSGTPTLANQSTVLRIRDNAGSGQQTVTVASSYSYNFGAARTVWTQQFGTWEEVKFTYDPVSTQWFMAGEPVLVTDLVHKSSPIAADAVLVWDSVTKSMQYSLISDLPTPVRSITWEFDNGSSVLNTGQAHRVFSIPYAATFVGCEITGYPSGSAAFDVYMATSGTTPSVSLFSSNFPTITSATQLINAAWPSGGTTAIVAHNVFDCNLTSVTTMTHVKLVLYYTTPL